MRNSSSSRRKSRAVRQNSDSNFVIKTTIQSIAALLIFLFVWGMSVSSSPKVTEICDKIRHYLTYTYDVQSVFNTLYNVPEVNDDTH